MDKLCSTKNEEAISSVLLMLLVLYNKTFCVIHFYFVYTFRAGWAERSMQHKNGLPEKTDSQMGVREPKRLKPAALTECHIVARMKVITFSNSVIFLILYWIKRKLRDRRSCPVSWPRKTNTVRRGSIPGRVVPKTWKTANCSSALMGGCKEKAHARCCHWLATNAAFTAKVAARPSAQTSGNGRRWPITVRTPKGVKSGNNATKTEPLRVIARDRFLCAKKRCEITWSVSVSSY